MNAVDPVDAELAVLPVEQLARVFFELCGGKGGTAGPCPGGTGTRPAITSAERFALSEYRVTGAYREVNHGLRDGMRLSPYAMKVQRGVDAAIAKTALKSDTVVWRGLNSFAALHDAKVGTVLQDRGFFSTSRHQDVAESFGRYGDVLKITVPKGYPALDTSVMGRTPGGFGWEKELLLPRGTQLRITKIGVNVTEAEVIR